MADSPGDRVTMLLRAWQRGDAGAVDELVPLVYAELHQIAARKLRTERGQTLPPTALVNEAWLRLSGQHREWQNREQFFALAAQAMRRILVDRARRRHAARRGQGADHVALENDSLPMLMPDDRLIALDEALDRLSALDARQARIIELRFFAGLSIDDTARLLDVPSVTVKREWKTARTWLFRELQAS